MSVPNKITAIDIQTDRWNKQVKRYLSVSTLILITFLLTLAFVNNLIVETINGNGFFEQIVDTIVLDPDKAFETDSSTENFEIRGNLIDSNGNPLPNEVVEIRSEPRYTTTDINGLFVFENVELGNHKISVIQNGIEVASCKIRVERQSEVEITKEPTLDNGRYSIQIRGNVFCIEATIKVNGDKLIITNMKEDETGSDVSENTMDSSNPSSTSNPTNNDTPKPTDIGPSSKPNETPPPSGKPSPTLSPTPTAAQTPTATTTPTPTTAPSPEASVPGISAGDYYNSSKKWNQLTAIDIFAPRAGNSGVSTIDGKNVISPGASGSYIFKLENSESYDIIYSIRLQVSDGNAPQLPMRYRIKTGTSGSYYIGGSGWKTSEEILVDSAFISSGETKEYTLEWKWVTTSDSVDTQIGLQSGKPSYVLNILISAQGD